MTGTCNWTLTRCQKQTHTHRERAAALVLRYQLSLKFALTSDKIVILSINPFQWTMYLPPIKTPFKMQKSTPPIKYAETNLTPMPASLPESEPQHFKALGTNKWIALKAQASTFSTHPVQFDQNELILSINVIVTSRMIQFAPKFNWDFSCASLCISSFKEQGFQCSQLL